MTTATMPERATGRKLGDVRAVAEKLDCSPRHVYRLADAGRMSPPLRLASLVRWPIVAAFAVGRQRIGCDHLPPERKGDTDGTLYGDISRPEPGAWVSPIP
jgi:hypothetical protein